ncbi:MAG: hypothetical protein IKH59_04955 [Bacteroidaceae bacterium]|jgi:F-type H+-transporting ATPase subunit epsilon|nr:hypothetical protein [Bacteroidaceae bacterium]
MRLLVLSPEQTLLDMEVSVVDLPGAIGRFTVLRGHDNLISTLNEGIIRYLPMASAADDEKEMLEIDGGFVEVRDNVITVCVD